MPRPARRARLVAFSLSLAPIALFACSRGEAPVSSSIVSSSSSSIVDAITGAGSPMSDSSSPRAPVSALDPTAPTDPTTASASTASALSSASTSALASASRVAAASSALASASPSSSTFSWSTLAASASASVIVPDAIGAPDLRRRMRDSRYSPVP